MIENLIGYTFKNKALLKQALTHPSHSTSNFQIFEFLGDRVFGMIIACSLFKNHKRIKTMAMEFSNLVSTEALVKIANLWQINLYLKHDIENISNKVLADTVEAIIAAIYLDSDFETVYTIVQNVYKTYLKKLENKIEPKMYLQELSQSKMLGLPVYKVVNIEGEEHKKNYSIKVSVENLGSALGHGPSKHMASKMAASRLIELLNEEH